MVRGVFRSIHFLQVFVAILLKLLEVHLRQIGYQISSFSLPDEVHGDARQDSEPVNVQEEECAQQKIEERPIADVSFVLPKVPRHPRPSRSQDFGGKNVETAPCICQIQRCEGQDVQQLQIRIDKRLAKINPNVRDAVEEDGQRSYAHEITHERCEDQRNRNGRVPEFLMR